MNGIEEHNGSLDYIIKCAKLVDMETENTPIDMTFVAKLVKRVYDKGYKDGQKALAVHLELCREEQDDERNRGTDMTTTTYTLEDAKRAIFKGMEQISKGEIDLSHFKHALYVL